MRRLLNAPIAKRDAYATAQYGCPRCGKEMTLLGRQQDQAKLRTPKCHATPMNRLDYTVMDRDPPKAMLDKLNASPNAWTSVNVVPGKAGAHKERPEGASPELAAREYEYVTHLNEHGEVDGVTVNEGRRGSYTSLGSAMSGPLREGETLADAMKRTFDSAPRVLQSGRNRRD